MKTQKARSGAKSSPSYRGKSCFTLRGRKKKDGVIQGKIRMRSMPGAFFVLGFLVVIVGTILAVAGYWPYQISKISLLGAAERESISESPASAWSVGPKSFLSTGSLMHSERMKLLGPVIMGVGLFILICANTVLYENRDRETQMLLAQMRSVICSVSTAVPSVDLKRIAAANAMAKQYQWVSSLPAAHLNIICLQQLAISEPMLQSRQHTEQENNTGGFYMYQRPDVQTKALHHQDSKPLPSLHSHLSNSSNASQTDLYTQHVALLRGSGNFSLEPTLFIKHNNCLVSASSMSTLGVNSEEIPATQLRRCQSMSYRTKPYTAHSPVCVEVGFYTAEEEGEINQPLVKETGSQVIINIPGHVVEAMEELTHRSWPRLDLGTGRRYMKLENKGDSVDKLLDLLEQQCLQWDKTFGSGPFQWQVLLIQMSVAI